MNPPIAPNRPDHPEKRPFVIGICGLAKAGKSTFAERLKHELSRKHVGAVIQPFAAPLKRGLSEMGVDKVDTPDLYRYAAQRIGTDIFRDRCPDHWVGLFRDAVTESPRVLSTETTPSGGVKVTYLDVVIADDVRFQNEVDTVLDLGGMMVYVDAADRLGLRRKSRWSGKRRISTRGKANKVYRHASERLALGMASAFHPVFGFTRGQYPYVSPTDNNDEHCDLRLNAAVDHVAALAMAWHRRSAHPSHPATVCCSDIEEW